MNIRLQEYLLDCLLCHTKGETKQATELESVVRFVLRRGVFEESNRCLKSFITKICGIIVK